MIEHINDVHGSGKSLDILLGCNYFLIGEKLPESLNPLKDLEIIKAECGSIDETPS